MKKLTWTQILLVLSTLLNVLGGTSVIPPVSGAPVCPPTVTDAKPAPPAPAVEVDDAGLTK